MKKVYVDYNKSNFKKIILKFKDLDNSLTFKIKFSEKANLIKISKFLKRNKIKFSFVVASSNYSNAVLRLIKDKKNPVTMQFIVDKALTKKDMIFFNNLSIINRNFEVFDYENKACSEFFKNVKNISYFTLPSEKEQNRMLYVYCNNGNSYCKWSSCLGKVLFINKEGDISFCPKYSKKTYLQNFSSVKSFDEIFDNEVFIKYLEKMICKRNECKAKCKYFNKCKGGCPLEEECISFEETYLLAQNEVRKILDNNINLEELPLSVKENILWLLCDNRKKW